MITHTVDHLYQAGIKHIIAVVGYQADSVAPPSVTTSPTPFKPIS
jgi:choline kinase